MEAAVSVYLVLAIVLVAAIGLTGLGLLFVRASNIERNVLVGVCTLVTTAIGIVLLNYLIKQSPTFAVAQLVSVVMVSVLGLVVGWVLDRIAGPSDHFTEDGATLGADLSD